MLNLKKCYSIEFFLISECSCLYVLLIIWSKNCRLNNLKIDINMLFGSFVNLNL